MPDECCPDAGNRLFPIFIEISYTNRPDLGIGISDCGCSNHKSDIRIPKSTWGRQASTGACIDLWMHVGLFVGELVNKTYKTQMLIKN